MALFVSDPLVSPRRGRERRRRGDLYPTLDLHGDTADEAVRRSREWLRAQQRAGERTVQLITGRGLHSVSGPVIRVEVESLLRDSGPELVTHFVSTAAGGAFLVELAPHRPQLPSRTRPRPGDADLRRRAEDALSELGIRPTPELVEAEMRRLRDHRSDEPA